jgi:hypothetical protein
MSSSEIRSHRETACLASTAANDLRTQTFSNKRSACPERWGKARPISHGNLKEAEVIQVSGILSYFQSNDHRYLDINLFVAIIEQFVRFDFT